LYILIFKFFDSNREDRRLWAEWYLSNTSTLNSAVV
jgi:hypothetical protein